MHILYIIHITEILWVLNMNANSFSYNSCKNLQSIFRKMFKESEIAERMSLGPSKAAYSTAYGLAPYFKEVLNKETKSLEVFVICIDES